VRIAFLGLRAIGPDSTGTGGVEKAVEHLSAHLAARGHEVTVFCRARYNPKRVRSVQGVRLVNLPALYTKHLEAFTHSLLAALVSCAGYDVVHVNATGPSMLSFIPRLAGRRVVVTVHGLDWKREKWTGFARRALRVGERTAIHFPHRTIVVSRFLRQYYERRYGRRTIYIPNGVPPAVCRPVDRLRRFGVRGGDYLLYLGRLVPEKGAHLLIEAFRSLNAEHRLLIVGGGTHTEDYVARLRALSGGDPRIVFTGPLYGEEKDEAYTNALCLVLPSTLEGMPIVLLEGLGCGCPTICSDIPENLEVIWPMKTEDGATPAPVCPYGYTFQSESAEDLRARIAYVLEHREEAAAKAREARSYVNDTFSWERIAEETEQVYASVLKR
jgi:glycosyltransferase involved in cell wall biosynthesis